MMNIQVNEKTMQELKQIAELRDISIEQAGSLALKKFAGMRANAKQRQEQAKESMIERGKPSEMKSVELLERYSYFAGMDYRTKEEQEYIGLLRREMIRRMES